MFLLGLYILVGIVFFMWLSLESVGCVFQMLAVLESKVLWINPDCGLKTRKYAEVVPALTNLVNAAKQLRAELAK